MLNPTPATTPPSPWPPPTAHPSELRAALEDHLAEPGRTWLRQALHHAATATPAAAGGAPRRPGQLPAWEREFAAAGRRCRAARAPHPEQAAVAARVLLLHTAHADAGTAARLYRQGTAEERCAVLTALPHLDVGDAAVELVEDALRANDTRLVTAAVGPYAAAHLPAHSWRHAVLKCLFTGVPVAAVAGLAERSRGDAELARMLTDYASERTAAGRDVPDDLNHVLRLTGHPPRTTPTPDSALPTREES